MQRCCCKHFIKISLNLLTLIQHSDDEIRNLLIFFSHDETCCHNSKEILNLLIDSNNLTEMLIPWSDKRTWNYVRPGYSHQKLQRFLESWKGDANFKFGQYQFGSRYSHKNKKFKSNSDSPLSVEHPAIDCLSH